MVGSRTWITAAGRSMRVTGSNHVPGVTARQCRLEAPLFPDFARIAVLGLLVMLAYLRYAAAGAAIPQPMGFRESWRAAVVLCSFGSADVR